VFQSAVFERDKRCIATDTKDPDLLVAANIIPLDKCYLIERKHVYSPKNGVLLLDLLEKDYDRHMWYFDENGRVFVLFKRWSFKEIVLKVNLARGSDAPSAELIKLHNEMAKKEAKHHCPLCWKFVGKFNIKDHQSGSCNMLHHDSDDKDQ
jgi:hypothetical protein